MGVSCVFTNSKYTCIFGWFLLTIDICSMFLAFCAYCFLLLSIILIVGLDMQYLCVIIAVMHICLTIFFVILDICFKNNIILIIHESAATIDNVTTYGTIESIQPEYDEDDCFNQNPWLLYRTEYYMVVGFRIICIAVDVAILCVFNDGWNCVNSYVC